MQIHKPVIFLIFVIFFPVQFIFAQGYLHRNGRYIFDGAGNEVILRGIGTGNWMLQEGYMMQTSGVAGTQHEFRAKLTATIGAEKTDLFYNKWLECHFTKTDVDSLKAWGFNSVRVAMHYKWFTPPIEDEAVPGEITWIEKGFVMIDSLLKWCGDNEMYLILDLHGAPGGQGKDANISDYDPSKPSLWESQLNKDKTIALWRKLAERYSEETWIGGYDLINETNWTFPEGNNSQLRKLMVDITNAIREVDKNHIIFVEGNGFANDFSGMTPPWDANMAYSFHKYWTYNTQESINFAINLRNSHNVPIWMGESGENSNVWFTSLISLLERNRIGWAMWPVKKPGINNPLRVLVNSDYTRLVNYWRGTATNPGVDAAFDAVMTFAENHRIENCIVQKDVIDAMFRQTTTVETIPYNIYTAGEPVFAVDYNLGRSGYAYFDNDSANFHISTDSYTNWNQGWSYRNDGVDIEPCNDTQVSNGFNIGWTEDGEWMEYTLVADSVAAYTLSIRSASGSGGAKVRLEANGNTITPLISLPGTSGWQNWHTTEVPGIILPGGEQKVRFIFEQGGSNLNYFMFSEPADIGSLPFRHLYAASSADGQTIMLTLNKAITTAAGDIDPAGFSVTCDNVDMGILSVSFDEDNPHVIQLFVGEPLYYGGIIKLSYAGNTVLSGEQLLESFSGLEVKNNLPFRVTLPTRVQAEDFYYNHGMVAENCTDTGGGLNMGYANPGDYLDYLVYVPKTAYYTINFRVATIRSLSELVVRIGDGTSFTDAATLAITPTGGWQSWTTLPVTAFMPEGRYTLRLYIKSGEFNINWFQFITTTVGIHSVSTKELNVYPNPAGNYLTIDLEDMGGHPTVITIYNSLGQAVKSAGTYLDEKVVVDIANLRKGLYFVVAKNDKFALSASKLIIKHDHP